MKRIDRRELGSVTDNNSVQEAGLSTSKLILEESKNITTQSFP